MNYFSIIFSITGVLISIISVSYVVLSYRNNKGRLKISFDIMEDGVRIHALNVGHRPLGIQDVGYFSWTLGSYSVAGNKQVFEILGESEAKTFKEMFGKGRTKFADIKNIGVRDISGNIWYANKYQLERLNEHIYAKPNADGYFTKRMDSTAWGKKIIKQRKSSLEKYLKFISKNNYDNLLKGKLGLHAGDKFISDKILNKFE